MSAFSLLLGAALLAPSTAHAERGDRDRPLELEAGDAVYDDLKQSYHLTGSVVLTKGSLLLKAEVADLRVDPEGYQHATATGSSGRQAYLRQKRDGNNNDVIEGWGDRIEYDGKTEIFRLIGHARAARRQGDTLADDIRGATITYDSVREIYSASGGGSSSGSGQAASGGGLNTGGDGRVRAVLTPRHSTAPAPAPQSGSGARP